MVVRTFELPEVDQRRGEIHVGSAGRHAIPELLRQSHRLLAHRPTPRVLGAHRVHAAEQLHRPEPHGRVLETLGELAHPRESAKRFLVAPAVDGDRRPPELMEKRHLAPQTLRGLGSRQQEIECSLLVQANLPIEARSA
jgi:hypothetical protein